MRIFVPLERSETETRVALTPEAVAQLRKLDERIAIAVEAGAGRHIDVADAAYGEAGAEVVSDRAAELGRADLVVRVNPCPEEEIDALGSGTAHISFLDPFSRTDLVRRLAGAGIRAFSVEMIPRTTLAQKMDALSSQANLAGYRAVILGQQHLGKVFPMFMTAAGTIQPARVFVIGVGVAGLQAIATAKRLGARVEAFDTRPVVREQVQSLGARFIDIDLGETGQTEGGYARELTAEQLARQQAEQARVCAYSDVVITTAQVFGRPAPRLITEAVLRDMKPGSVVVDMAAATGGNVEGSVAGEVITTPGGVKVVGGDNLPASVPRDASMVYANNLLGLIELLWDAEAGQIRADTDDEIIAGCLITDAGELVNTAVAEHCKKEESA
ncbi:MAG: Re/Si-specific NAD(P)(+) transhydrogenase subunit alpha [Gammaproteobacteria bacterium AqS3]|nr:Re/Si-specific NAD(P)(+) transhydrogenase subunit alpha [Gammaproteobacteria bacterium AqS3]